MQSENAAYDSSKQGQFLGNRLTSVSTAYVQLIAEQAFESPIFFVLFHQRPIVCTGGLGTRPGIERFKGSVETLWDKTPYLPLCHESWKLFFHLLISSTAESLPPLFFLEGSGHSPRGRLLGNKEQQQPTSFQKTSFSLVILHWVVHQGKSHSE